MFYKRMSETLFDVPLWILQYFVIYFKTQILEKNSYTSVSMPRI